MVDGKATLHDRDPGRPARGPARSARRRGRGQPQMPGADRRPAVARPCARRLRRPRRASTASGSRSSRAPARRCSPIALASGLPVSFVASAGDDHRQRLCGGGRQRGAARHHHRRQCAADPGRGPRGRGAAGRRRRRGGRARPQGGRALRPSRGPAALLQVPRRPVLQLQPLRPLAPWARARRDLPGGRPVRQESDADRARLRLRQPDPAALRADHAGKRDAAAGPALRRARFGGGA